jgi:hypothetical protein
MAGQRQMAGLSDRERAELRELELRIQRDDPLLEQWFKYESGRLPKDSRMSRRWLIDLVSGLLIIFGVVAVLAGSAAFAVLAGIGLAIASCCRYASTIFRSDRPAGR